jgi:hypothetical protein
VSALVAWTCLGLWSAWAFALQGALAQGALGLWGGAGPLVPDLGVVLLIGLASRMPARRARLGALLLGLVRASQSADPWPAILCAYLALASLVSLLRRVVDTDRRVWRTVLGGCGAVGVAAWLLAVDGLRADTPAPWARAFGPWIWSTGLCTAAAGLLGGGLLRRLPGIGPLWRRAQPWGIDARTR